MRNTPPYACPQCGDSGLSADDCVRCRTPMLDANGDPPLAPRVFVSSPRSLMPVRIIGGVIAVFGGMLHLALMLLGPAFVAVVAAAYRLPELRRSRARKRHDAELQTLLRDAPEVQPIGEVASGVVRVRGRVRVLEPAPGARTRDVAVHRVASRTAVVVDTGARYGIAVGDALHEPRTLILAEHGQEMEHSACGRFVVEDDTGLALVDDDAFDLVLPGSVERRGELDVREGDIVEVAGPAQRKQMPKDERVDRGRRSSKTWVVFDGDARRRVLIVPIERPVPPLTGRAPDHD